MPRLQGEMVSVPTWKTSWISYYPQPLSRILKWEFEGGVLDVDERSFGCMYDEGFVGSSAADLFIFYDRTVIGSIIFPFQHFIILKRLRVTRDSYFHV